MQAEQCRLQAVLSTKGAPAWWEFVVPSRFQCGGATESFALARGFAPGITAQNTNYTFTLPFVCGLC